LKFVLSCVIKD